MSIEERILRKFNKSLKQYNLISDGDRVLIALSGGKDSLCLTEMIAHRQRIFVPRFTAEAVHVRMENIEYESSIEELCKFTESLGVPLHIITTSFDASTDRRHTPCFLCSWQRRKAIFNFAQEHGFNKIALGHHMDDILHTALLNLFHEGRFDSMPPVLHMQKMPLTIIRPLCLIHEADIARLSEEKGYPQQIRRCPYEHDSRREEMKRLFTTIETLNPEARYSLWHALENSSTASKEEEA
ncbi:MAG: tRNA 2-thiocytidine biosynthesis protein TtcA [Prevotella sp.]|nr:tRNA 2-thiocytidine biosynthesis protein TtcA [Prevotella sp.]